MSVNAPTHGKPEILETSCNGGLLKEFQEVRDHYSGDDTGDGLLDVWARVYTPVWCCGRGCHCQVCSSLCC